MERLRNTLGLVLLGLPLLVPVACGRPRPIAVAPRAAMDAGVSVLLFTLNGKGGLQFTTHDNDPLRFLIALHDPQQRFERGNAPGASANGRPPPFVLQVRSATEPYQVKTGMALEPAVPTEIRKDIQGKAVYQFRAELGPLPAADYAIVLLLLEPYQGAATTTPGFDPQTDSQVIVRELMSVPLTVSKASQ